MESLLVEQAKAGLKDVATFALRVFNRLSRWVRMNVHSENPQIPRAFRCGLLFTGALLRLYLFSTGPTHTGVERAAGIPRPGSQRGPPTKKGRPVVGTALRHSRPAHVRLEVKTQAQRAGERAR